MTRERIPYGEGNPHLHHPDGVRREGDWYIVRAHGHDTVRTQDKNDAMRAYWGLTTDQTVSAAEYGYNSRPPGMRFKP